MKTEILSISDASLRLAGRILNSSDLVAFPTETVYGLGANALDDAAVKRIFEVKGRPQDNPLIVHVAPDYDLSLLVKNISGYAEKLIERFMPGPLTLVFESKGAVAKSVSPGLDTLAVRMPSHEGAKRFLKFTGIPVAAPSANISKHVSPVTAQHVYDDLNGKIPLILDGGRCEGGIESTVLDVTGEVPVILRPGLVTFGMIFKAVGACDIYQGGGRIRSPGMKYKHYSPSCETVLIGAKELEKGIEIYEKSLKDGKIPYYICDDAAAESLKGKNILRLGNREDISKNLYYSLREGEKLADILICIEPEGEDLEGVLNRLKKAAGGKE